MKGFYLAVAGIVALLGIVAVQPVTAAGNYEIDYSAQALLNAGRGDFAPYYVASNRHGVVTQSRGALLRLSASRKMRSADLFSYGFGIDVAGGYSSGVDYLRWYDGEVQWHKEHPSRMRLQQLYGEVKWRGVFLSSGLKERSSALLDSRLSSGDLVESGNARPIPEVRVGFLDFQDIPFTNGWVQIQGEISYGKFTDNAWLRDHYNYIGQHLNQGALYTYKRCYFRTNPDKRFSVTLGMQVGGSLGGNTTWYDRGRVVKTRHFDSGIKSFFKMLVPTDGGDEYYAGSSLGSWDVLLRYNLRNGMTFRGYMQKPWEDGSGIGFLNGFDGLWGLELRTNRRGPVTAVVVEYLDFTNQSGPMHWDPDDHPGTGIRGRAEGADNYYNNHEYNSYANYGMAIGSPFLVSPVYNVDGCMQFLHNRIRGFHVGIEGDVTRRLSYRALGSYRKSWGTGYLPLVTPASDVSLMIEGRYDFARVRGLSVNAQLGFDYGSLYGDNFGACVTVVYRGAIRL